MVSSKYKLSVALCTCNGEKYIEQQLRSIINQELAVDEIIVSDDLSTDRTIQIVRQIQSETSIPIHILLNPTDRHWGVCQNFEKAIAATTGDIIFLSDQDDCWLPEKTRQSVEWLKQHPQKQMLFTDAYLIDDNGEKIMREQQPLTVMLNNGMAGVIDELLESDYMLESFLVNNIYTGAMLALRRELVENVPLLKLGEGRLHHDAVISMLAIDKQVVGYLAEPLICYRLHQGQVCGLPLWLSKSKTLAECVYPTGSYLLTVDYDKWDLRENIKQRIHFYNERNSLVSNVLWGG